MAVIESDVHHEVDTFQPAVAQNSRCGFRGHLIDRTTLAIHEPERQQICQHQHQNFKPLNLLQQGHLRVLPWCQPQPATAAPQCSTGTHLCPSHVCLILLCITQIYACTSCFTFRLLAEFLEEAYVKSLLNKW